MKRARVSTNRREGGSGALTVGVLRVPGSTLALALALALTLTLALTLALVVRHAALSLGAEGGDSLYVLPRML